MDLWYCQDCVKRYDTRIQDVPIKDLRKVKVKAYPELDKYPTYEENEMFISYSVEK
jgi:hypothetical protein